MINNKKILSIITARAGSKGIPNKNIKELMGKPLFEWSVLASLNSKYIDKTVISSDSREIELIYIDRVKKDQKWENVAFIKRPKKISGDLSINEEALIHAYNQMRMISNSDYSIILNLQPTSPVRLNSLIDRCIEKYSNGEYNSLLTASVHTPFFWQKKNGKWEYINRYFEVGYVKREWQPRETYQMIPAFDDCCNRKMRQQFKDFKEDNSDLLLHDNGSVYIMNTEILLSTKCRIGNNPCIFPVEKLNSLQIDTEFDFKLIENMIKSYNLEKLY